MIREIAALDSDAMRRDVLSDKRPAIFRGLVADWPAVKRGLVSPAALVVYLNRFDSGKSVDALLAAPEIDGELFYNGDMTGFNFLRNRLPLAAVAEQVLRYAQFPTVSGGCGAERPHPRLPAWLHRGEFPEYRRCQCAAPHLARQSDYHPHSRR